MLQSMPECDSLLSWSTTRSTHHIFCVFSSPVLFPSLGNWKYTVRNMCICLFEYPYSFPLHIGRKDWLIVDYFTFFPRLSNFQVEILRVGQRLPNFIKENHSCSNWVSLQWLTATCQQFVLYSSVTFYSPSVFSGVISTFQNDGSKKGKNVDIHIFKKTPHQTHTEWVIYLIWLDDYATKPEGTHWGTSSWQSEMGSLA